MSDRFRDGSLVKAGHRTSKRRWGIIGTNENGYAVVFWSDWGTGLGTYRTSSIDSLIESNDWTVEAF